MPAVLVHGVPETERVWDELRRHLSRDDVVALSLPGFGQPLPHGFQPTKDSYAAWVIDEVERLGEPVDLVGHDWGGGFALRLVSLRPDLVRSWVLDAAGLADPDFAWHQFATVWQTPDEGEAFMEGWLASPVDQRALMFGTPPPPGETEVAVATAFNRTMADAILTLYRSATAVHQEWGPAFADIPRPGMVLVPEHDPFLDEQAARRAGERAGAKIVDIPGQGHWWMLTAPEAGAQILEDFWASAP